MKKIFTIDDERVKRLAETDNRLRQLINVVGPVEQTIDEDYYYSLVKSIIGQQLSLKAAGTIIGRVELLWEDFNPEKLKDITDDELRGAGLSRPKMNYIRDLTNKYLSDGLDFNKLNDLSNKEAISELTEIKGIGPWTAEMFLTFSLGRLNVLSYGDVSIQNAIRWLYDISKEAPLNLDVFYHKWNPYNSIASLYLWAAIDKGFVSKNFMEIFKT